MSRTCFANAGGHINTTNLIPRKSISVLVYAVKKDKISADYVIINYVDEFSECDLVYYFQCFMYNCVVA